jgi:hypothetical protein
MRTDWIFKVEAKVCPNLRPIILLKAEVVLSGDVVIMVHHEEVIVLVAEVEEASSSPRTSSIHVNSVARPTIRCSSTWEKKEVLIWLTHMGLIQIGMLTPEQLIT